MIGKIGNFVTRYPVPVIIVCLIIIAALGSGVRKVKIDENMKAMLPEDLPSRQTLNELEDIFGGSDVALIAIHNPEGVFNPATLAKVRAMTDSVESMDQVVRVASLSTTSHIMGTEWGMEVIPFLEVVPETQEEADSIRQMVFYDSLQIGQIVSEDGDWTAIMIVLEKGSDTKSIYGTISRLRDNFSGPENIYLAGIPIIQYIVGNSIKSDLARLIPFVILIVAIILFLSFRSISGVILPLLAALLSTLAMVGLMGHIGIEFMVVNNVMPVILIAVGVSYVIHIIVGYYEEYKLCKDKKSAIMTTLEHIGSPILLAGLTTIIGFGTMITAPLPVYGKLGAMLGFGVLTVTIISLTFIPSVLVLLPAPRHLVKVGKTGLIDRFLDALAKFAIRRRRSVIIVGILIVLVFAIGLPYVVIDMNPISFFPKRDPLRVADSQVNHHLGGSINMNMLFTGNAKDPELLKAIDKTQEFIDNIPETGSSISLATMVKRINRVLNEDDPAKEVIPDTENQVAQAIFMYESSGDPADFEFFVDYDYQHTQIIARLKSVSTSKIASLAQSVSDYLEENFGSIGSVQTTGFFVFLKDLANLVIISQIRSLLLSALIIAIIAWIAYHSLIRAILAVIPILMTIVINFGLMGISGIALSLPTAIISSIIIGIGVDFALHYLSRFSLELKQGASSEEAAANSIRRVGKAILFDATPTAIGFLVLLSSGFLPVRYMGMLIALTMMICAVGALTILPAALSFTKNKIK